MMGLPGEEDLITGYTLFHIISISECGWQTNFKVHSIYIKWALSIILAHIML